MTIVFMISVTILLLAAAAYTHLRIGQHTRRARNRALLRGVLIVAGGGFGYVTTIYYLQAEGLRALLGFLSGFGLVHVPAAFILFLKRMRGDGQSQPPLPLTIAASLLCSSA